MTIRPLALVLQILLMLAVPHLGLCANILVDGTAANIHGTIKRTFSFSEVLGFTGDYIPLDDGYHQLEVTTNHYRFFLNITVEGSGVTVEQTKPSGECVPEKSQVWVVNKWEPPTVTVAPSVTRILLKKPESKLTKEPLCSSAYSAYALGLGCQQLHGIVVLESDPVGAEIWIDGKLMDHKTNARLSVPYCKDSKAYDPFKNRTTTMYTQTHVLMRMPNRLNCNKEIQIERGEQRINCQMPGVMIASDPLH